MGMEHLAPAPLTLDETERLDTSLAITQSGVLVGIDARGVRVEARVGTGLPTFDIVGLPERGVRESRVRVRSALGASGFEMPRRQLVVNLAPAHLRKRGTGMDLAVAVAVLAASAQLDAPARETARQTLFLAELGLDGGLRPVPGILPQLRGASERGISRAVVSRGSAPELSFAPEGMEVFVMEHLRDVAEWLDGAHRDPFDAGGALTPPPDSPLDLSELRGQREARMALTIAAAGGHHLLLVGPPGGGKTMLARRLPQLLPAPTRAEVIDIATIASAAGMPPRRSRPFRAPHHTASAVALIGGGDPVRPGEVTLAHHGVLFLDELAEFRRDAIETLRTTMETGEVNIARAGSRVTMPAKPLVVAAMNPCPCGYRGDPSDRCHCSDEAVARYQRRISGPLLDRFDLQVVVPRIPTADLRRLRPGESSAEVRAQVARVRRERVLPLAELHALSAPGALDTLQEESESRQLSARAYVKLLRIARTLADLAGVEKVRARDIRQALRYRALDGRRPIAP